METEISFSPYDATELRTILYDRAERAFVEGGYNKSAIEMAAAVAASDMGNARQAIDILRIGAEVAKKTDDDCVTDSHINEARALAERGRLSNRIRDQTQHAQLILETIAHLEQHDKTPVRSKAIQKHYETIAEAWGVDPLTSLKSIQDHLSDLHMLGFLHKNERNKGLNGGQYYEHELDLDPAIVLETRNEMKAEESN